jgi:hypothetical protein
VTIQRILVAFDATAIDDRHRRGFFTDRGGVLAQPADFYATCPKAMHPGGPELMR